MLQVKGAAPSDAARAPIFSARDSNSARLAPLPSTILFLVARRRLDLFDFSIFERKTVQCRDVLSASEMIWLDIFSLKYFMLKI